MISLTSPSGTTHPCTRGMFSILKISTSEDDSNSKMLSRPSLSKSYVDIKASVQPWQGADDPVELFGVDFILEGAWVGEVVSVIKEVVADFLDEHLMGNKGIVFVEVDLFFQQ
mmetsp:Transcript_11229/g.22089  ORF Transcript_11229/g.22089 Transcript_11229/m.22089 type:complete len:113 (-) Transcript_11229:129-467(-)